MITLDGWGIFWGILGWVLATVLAGAVAIIIAGILVGVFRSVRRLFRKEMSEATKLKHFARAQEIYEAAYEVGMVMFKDRWFDAEGQARAYAQGARWSYLREHGLNP